MIFYINFQREFLDDFKTLSFKHVSSVVKYPPPQKYGLFWDFTDSIDSGVKKKVVYMYYFVLVVGRKKSMGNYVRAYGK